MTLSTHPTPALALGALIDYAGLFPPAKLAMAPALDEYLAARDGAHAWMLGRFIVPASRIGELLGALGTRGPLRASVIVDAGSDPRAWFAQAGQIVERLAHLRVGTPALVIEALEVPLPPLASARDGYDATIGQFAMLAERQGLRELPIYVELPTGAANLELLRGGIAALARHRLHAKVRCGGTHAAAFPSVDELAAFVVACADENVAFKATAGLHHPIRHTQAETGFPMHGFLNLLAAAAFAGDADARAVSDVLAEEDPTAFALDADGLRVGERRADVEHLRAARARFVGYGSCSFAEPVEDLTALHILKA
ncbi:MAG: hypothetical protein KGN02_04765 [bacterium]|nr:hypothetical protein [bacterium]